MPAIQKTKEDIEKNTSFEVVHLSYNLLTEINILLYKDSGIFDIIELKHVKDVFQK
ncbi:MAG: hypothetical protein V3V33_05715 [Candidatus Lokiarchaeia archaeon]